MELAGPSIHWSGSTPTLLPISVQNRGTPLPLDLFEPATNTCKPLDMLDLDALQPENFFSDSLADQDSAQGDVHMYSCSASQGSMLDLPPPCEGLSTMGLGMSPMHMPLPLDRHAQHFPLAQSRMPPSMPDLRPVAGLNHAFPPAPPEYSDPVYAAQQTMSNYVPMAGFEALIRPRESFSAPMSQPRQTGRQAEVENARFVLGGEHLPTFAPVEVRASLWEHMHSCELRLSAKLINIRPEDLPANLRQHLLAMMNVGVQGLEGYIRPGCVYLTVSVAVAATDADTVKAISLQAAFDRLLTLPEADFWRNHTSVIQLSKQLALVRGGRVVRTVDLDLSTVYPTLHSVSPVAVLAGATSVLELKGSNLHLPGCVVVARCQGKQCYLQPVDEQGRQTTNRGRSSTSLHVLLPADLIAGAWQIEVSCKSSLTDFQVVMVINDAEAVSELRQLEQPDVLENTDSAGAATNSMLLDRVMEYLNVVASVKAGNYDRLRTYQDADYQILVKLAQHVFLVATRKGWPAVARMVLGVACMGAASIVDVIRSMHSMSGGFSLLHLASCSRNPKMVEFVLEWTSSAGFELSAAVPGPGGFTPMHLAALLDDDGRIAVLLTSLCVDGKDAWQVSGDLMTPYDLARAAGTAGNIQNRLLAAAHQAEEIAAAGDAAILKAYLLEDSDDDNLLTDSDVDSESNEDTCSVGDRELDSFHTAGMGCQHVVSRSAAQTAKSSFFSESTGMEKVHCQAEGSGSRHQRSLDQMPSTKSLRALAMHMPCDDHSPKKYVLQNVKDLQKDNFLSSVKGMFNMGQGKSRTRSVSQMLQEVDFDDDDDNQGKYFGLPPLYWVPILFFLVCTGLASFFNRCAAHYSGTAAVTTLMQSHP